MRSDWEVTPDPLTLLRQGLPESFERFVQLESATFLGFYRRLGASPSEAEDLTQELFLRLLRSAAGYSGEGRFVPYCFRVARNLWIDQERRRAGRPVQAAGIDEEEQWAEPSPSGELVLERLELEDQGRRLLAALQELTEAQRSVFELAVVQERPYSEIAALLAIPVGTVKSRVFYCLQHLRARLGDSDSPGSAPAIHKPNPNAPGRRPSAPEPQ